MADKQITPTDLKKRAQNLLTLKKMPSLDDVLKAVAASRKEHASEIVEARKQSNDSDQS